MNQLTNDCSPDIEQKYLRYSTILSCMLVLIFLSHIIYYFFKQIDAEWVGATIFLTAFIAMFVVLIRLIILMPKLKHLFWGGNCQDEYLNHLAHRAAKYSANTALIASLILMFFADNMKLNGEAAAWIIASLTLFAYGAPLLFWLRGDNNGE